MAKRIAGICYVTVDGTQLELKSEKRGSTIESSVISLSPW